MTDDTSNGPPEHPRRRRRNLLPPSLVDLMGPPLQIGALAGTIGMSSGIAVGIVRGCTPALFALASGVQWFALGSSYWLSRTVVMSAWGSERKLTNSSKAQASAIAGGTAGMVGGLIRGPRNIIPGVLVFSLVGGTGQVLYNVMWDRPEATEKRSVCNSSWTPLRKLSDDEYREIIEEKMLKINVEIALVDDKIAELRAAKEANRPTSGQDTTQPPPASAR